VPLIQAGGSEGKKSKSPRKRETRRVRPFHPLEIACRLEVNHYVRMFKMAAWTTSSNSKSMRLTGPVRQRVGEESESGDRVRTGVSRVIDDGQQVVVLFSVVNPTTHAVLLMTPQIQLSGRTVSGS